MADHQSMGIAHLPIEGYIHGGGDENVAEN
jgi:hypothetical protein